MMPFELGQSKPDHALVNVDIYFFSHERGHLRDARLTVAMLPHPCCSFVQAVGLVPLEVIDENLVRESFDNQTFVAR
jgi:hypothetical protein